MRIAPLVVSLFTDQSGKTFFPQIGKLLWHHNIVEMHLTGVGPTLYIQAPSLRFTLPEMARPILRYMLSVKASRDFVRARITSGKRGGVGDLVRQVRLRDTQGSRGFICIRVTSDAGCIYAHPAIYEDIGI